MFPTKPIALDASVTIATAAYGNAQVTRTCLESLRLSATGDYELILIDDRSPDDGAIRRLFRAVRDSRPATRIFEFTENQEYTGSVNAVLSHATGRYVLFISNDIYVTPDYLRTLLEVARANPRMGILRGSANFVDNGLATHNLAVKEPITDLPGLFRASATCAQQFGHAALPDPFLVGDAFLVSREVIDRIGTFDPLFYGYFGDPDFGLRARIAGFETVLLQGAFAFHNQDSNFQYLPEDERNAKLNRRWMRVFENWARFKMKHGLPVPQPYTAIADVPWDRLAGQAFDPGRHFVPPGDYSRFEV
jgi:GT2 family glycosyltransferase